MSFDNPDFGPDGTDPRLVAQEADRPGETAQWGAPLTITDDGDIFGHAALWGRCHVGISDTCVRPPKESSAYKGFLTGQRDGTPVGTVVMGTGHAPMMASGRDAAAHYADTGRAVADVNVGTDDHGIWVAGRLRDGVDPVDVEALRASSLSGDWRDFGSGLRLVGLLAVNTPGFRVNRAVAASGALQTTGPGCEDCDDETEGDVPPAEDIAAIRDELRDVKRAVASLLAEGR